MMHTGISEQWHFAVKALVDNLHLEKRDFQSLKSLFFLVFIWYNYDVKEKEIWDGEFDGWCTLIWNYSFFKHLNF